MQFPQILTLEIRTQEEFDAVKLGLQALKGMNSTLLDTEETALFDELLDRAVFKLADGSKEARVLINGQPIATGTTEEMTKRYQTECGMHAKSNIVLQEWQNGDYKALQSRRHQKL